VVVLPEKYKPVVRNAVAAVVVFFGVLGVAAVWKHGQAHLARSESVSTCAFGVQDHDATVVLSGPGAAQVCDASIRKALHYVAVPTTKPTDFRLDVLCYLVKNDINMAVYDSNSHAYGNDICQGAFNQGWVKQ
jgi:hypothetical protein